MIRKIGEYNFELICEIRVELESERRPKEFLPYFRYKNSKHLPFNKYGKRPFCEFRVQNNFKNKSGVYSIYINNSLKYLGECEDLTKRFNTGYGHISPRNCFKGGQSTNCRIKLKAGIANNSVIGQILSYIHEIRQNLANGKEVKGIIIADEFEKRLIAAVSEIPHVSLKKYRVNFAFDDV